MKRLLILMLVLMFGACAAPAGRQAAAAGEMGGMKMGSAAGGSATPAVPADTVFIDNFSFSPATLTVAAGATVTWINRDDVPHTVTSVREPRVLDSRALDTDGKYTFTFNAAGTYEYFCTVHPQMTGRVVVK